VSFLTSSLIQPLERRPVPLSDNRHAQNWQQLNSGFSCRSQNPVEPSRSFLVLTEAADAQHVKSPLYAVTISSIAVHRVSTDTKW